MKYSLYTNKKCIALEALDVNVTHISSKLI